MIAALILALVGLIEALIGLRFLFLLIGANPNSGFVSAIYSWSEPFVAPFAGIFGQDSAVQTGAGVVTQSVLDWTALIAFVVYGLIGALVSRTLRSVTA